MPETVLIVDDEDGVRRTFQEWLAGVPNVRAFAAADAETEEDESALAGLNLLAGDPRDPRSAWLHRDGATWQVRRLRRAEVVEAARAASAARRAPAGAASSEARTPMPGTVVAVLAEDGTGLASALSHVPLYTHANPRLAYARLAARFHAPQPATVAAVAEFLHSLKP